MARSKGVTISVKIPIKWESMTEGSQQRLRQIVGRDSRVIRAYLGVIQNHEKTLLTGKRKNRIDDNKLHQMTLTATRGTSSRSSVLHDMKSRFPRISQNELTECRRTAVSNYESYLALRQRKGRSASHPCVKSKHGRIPRWTFTPQVFRFVQRDTSTARYWIDLRDSLDSSLNGSIKHDRLLIPLKIAPFHEQQLSRGTVKAAQIFTDRRRKWWVTLAVRLPEVDIQDYNLPPAVLGIDLGIEKAVCTTLVTPEKVRETRYFIQKEKREVLKRYDDSVSKLQHKMHTSCNNGQRYDQVARKLDDIRTKRLNVSKDYDRVLVRQLIDYISQLSERYTLHVAIGKLVNIRNVARRGNYRGNRFRRMIHSWSFSRITESLKHQLAQMGWSVDGKDSRFQAVPEAWTSIMCWKCGSRGQRPKQNYFRCPVCGHKTNADRNGAINIAARLIMLTKSLHSVRGLGKWASAVARSTQPKTRRKSSRGMSLLSSKGQVSDLGESAAVHVAQRSLLDFGDKVKSSDYDPAVEKSVENLSVTDNDTSVTIQEKEARPKELDYSGSLDKSSVHFIDSSSLEDNGDVEQRKGGTQKFQSSSLTSDTIEMVGAKRSTEY
ncbi:MAG: transposase [Candidatus Thorarchaeota archaeon]